MVELGELIRVEFTQVFEFVFFFITLLLLDSKSQIVFLDLPFSHESVLLFPSSECSDLISFRSLGTRNHLRVLVLNTRIVSYFGQLLIVLLRD
jgi:hypothetical protein